MKNLLLPIIGIFLLYFCNLSAQTNVSGSINTNTIWSIDQSPITLTGDVIVESTAILTIEPGVEINFNSRQNDLKILGTLSAQGTEQDSIRFYSSGGGNLGGSIEFLEGSSNSSLRYVNIEQHKPFSIYNNTRDCAVWIENAEVFISESSFIGNSKDVRSSINSVDGFNSSNDLSHIYLSSDSLDVNSTLPNADADGFNYYTTGDIVVNEGITLTINPGVSFNLNSRVHDLKILGTLTAEGTVQDSIRFHSLAAGNLGGSIEFLEGSSGSSMSYVNIEQHKPYSIYNNSRDCAVWIENADVSINKCNFDNNKDVRSTVNSVGGFSSDNSLNRIFLSADSLDVDSTLPNADTEGFDYYTTGDIVVQPGITLTINPGVSINLNLRSYDLKILGTLIANGTAEDSIRFHSLAAGNLGGSIEFLEGSSGSSMSYVNIEQHKPYSIYNNSRDCAVWIEDADVSIDKCTFDNNKDVRSTVNSVGGFSSDNSLNRIFLSADSLDVNAVLPNADTEGFDYYTTGDIVVQSGITLTINPGVSINLNLRSYDLKILGTLIADGTAEDSIRFHSLAAGNLGGSIEFLEGSSGSSMSYVNIEQHKPYSIYNNSRDCAVWIENADVSINKCAFDNNKDVRSTVNSVGGFSSDNSLNRIFLSADSLDVNAVLPNADTEGFDYYTTGDIVVQSGITLTINPGVSINLNLRSYDLKILGTLIANGTAEDSIRFHSLAAGNLGGSIEFLEGSSGNSMNYVNIEQHKPYSIYNNARNCAIFIQANCSIQNSSIKYNGTGIRIDSDVTPIITENKIYNNGTGIYILESNNPEISFNGFENNFSWGIQNGSNDTINACNNYWGDPTGPYNANNNPSGLGDNITDNVEAIDCFLEEPPYISISPIIVNASCAGVDDGSITLNFIGGTSPYTFFWETGEINISQNDSENSTTISNLPIGSYTFIIVDSEGLVINESYTISGPPAVSITNTGSNVICAGDSLLLIAENAATANWSTGETTDSIVVFPTSTTTYYVNANFGTGEGCESTDSITIEVFPINPTQTIIEFPTDNAVGVEIPFTVSWLPSSGATNYDVYLWESGNTQPTDPYATNLTNLNTTVNDLNSNTSYQLLIVAKNFCGESESEIITFTTTSLPDLEVSNVNSGLTNAQPNDPVTLTWDITNIGEGTAQIDWVEKIFIQSPDGSNKTIVGQFSYDGTETLNVNETINRVYEFNLPSNLAIGTQGVFVVELIPNIVEIPMSNDNNTAVENQPWNIESVLTLTCSSSEILENGNDLYCTITRSGSTDSDLTININISDPSRFIFSSVVVINAGQAGANFSISTIDNDDLDGDLELSLTAAATNFIIAEKQFLLIDDEIPTLTIENLPVTVEEGNMLSFDIVSNFSPTENLLVNIIASEVDDVPLPTPVTIQAGEISVNVQVTLPNDDFAEPDQTITITAGSAGYESAIESFTLTNDEDIPAISFEITIDTISESSGLYATQGVITRLGNADNVLQVDISASDPESLYLPLTVPLGPGEVEKTFSIGVFDNLLNEGFRDIEITASVLIAACNCTATATSAGVVSDILTIADNDGPTLNLYANPLSLAEGFNNAGTLTIERNTATDVDLTVNLSSSDDSELTVQNTIVIPTGSSSIDVPLTTIADGIVDGNQEVVIQAEADGFNLGLVTVIVTDNNKPDFQIVEVILTETTIEALEPFDFKALITNTGLANAPSGVLLSAYLSEDMFLSDEDILVGSYQTQESIVIGDTLEIWDVAIAPYEAGTYYLIFEINPDSDLTEIQYLNNTSSPIALEIEPDYLGTATVDELIFPQESSINIYGSSIDNNGIPIPNVELEIYIISGIFRQEILVTTDNEGNYNTIFEPLDFEAGHFIVGASFPNMGSTIVQDEFDVLGVEINAGDYLVWEVLLDQPQTGTISVTNRSEAVMTNVSIQVITLPNGVTLEIESISTLAANETTVVDYTLTGSEISPIGNYENILLEIISDEGLAQDLTAYYLCQAEQGYLDAEISSIDRTVSQSQSNFLEFYINNSGAGETGEITVDLPPVDFMSLVSMETIPSLSLGDSSLVIIEFIPSESLPLNTPATGTIIINAANGNFISLPYTVEKVSEETGGIIVDVVDEYTYFTEEAPHLENAHVKISHYFTGEVFAEGFTGIDGLFTANNLPEGILRLEVDAEQHDSFNDVIYIQPGTDIFETVFLSYQAITFTWEVVPIEVSDSYEIDLIVEFETNVPLPVVVIEVPEVMPQLFGNETFNFYATLTNHGLITANDVTLEFPADDPEYEFITNYQPGDLLAQQSIQVPVVMKLKTLVPERPIGGSNGLESISAKDENKTAMRMSDVPCGETAKATYTYVCGGNGQWEKVFKGYTYAKRTCSDPPDPNPDTSGDGESCPNCIPGSPSSTNSNPPTVYPEASCQECIADIYIAIFGCGPPPISTAAGVVSCGEDFVFDKFDNFAENLTSCGLGFVPVLGCLLGLWEAYETCRGSIQGRNGSGQSLNRISNASNIPPIIEAAFTDIEQVKIMLESILAIEDEFFGQISENDNLIEFIYACQYFIDNQIAINIQDAQNIKLAMQGFDISEEEIDAFIVRWNLSLEAWNNGVFSSNATYPDIINQNLINQYFDQMEVAHLYAIENGHASLVHMFNSAIQAILDQGEENENAVCSAVSIQMSQELTMTREAFEGTLGIENGHPDIAIDSFYLNLEILSPDGVLSNDLFQIELTDLNGLTGIDGEGMLAASSEGFATILFIPEVGAAPTTPIVYSFGGSISYLDPFTGLIITTPLVPVELVVNPSPDLYLHYFMQRDIYGDDPLTMPIEPIIPAELAVMVENNGYGTAMGVVIESSQPEIIDNEKGLAIEFSLIGSNLQGEPANLGLNNINFGDIDPLSTKVGQWYFTSTLLGHFIDYETNLVHLSSYGNPDLSLVSGATLHELIQSISVYSQEDGIDDFLVNDIQDADQIPDAIYLSQGNLIYDVYPAESGNFTGNIYAAGNTNTVNITPSAVGWNYIKLDDPGNGEFEIVSVTRNDGQEIPLKNAWLTHVTLPDSQEPIYENKFHFVDEFSSLGEVSYTIVWSQKDPSPPYVISISGQPDQVTSDQIETLTVTFSEEIDPTTFGIDDLNLILQGGANLIDNSVNITQIDSVTFEIDIASVTTGNGFYIFTVQAAGVEDLTGTSGLVGEQVSWTQFVDVPAIIEFVDLSSDNVLNDLSSIQVLFNMPIDISTLTQDDIAVLFGGNAQTGSLIITSLNPENTLFEITGLDSFINGDGDYELVIDLTGVQADDGIFGIANQSIAITLDTENPQLINLLQYIGGGLDPQHYTGADLNFDDEITPFSLGAFTLTKDGTPLDISNAEIEEIDPAWYQIESFGQATYPEGDYTLSVDMSLISDLAGNTGSGVEQISWTVNRTSNLVVSGLEISPDLGYSTTDGITSTTDITVSFGINEDVTIIEIYQNDNGTLTLLETLDNTPAGAVDIPLTFETGGNTALEIHITDENGNTIIETMDVYIDESALTAFWDFAPNQVLATHPDEILLTFSDQLLDVSEIQNALVLFFENTSLNASDLIVNPVSLTEFLISGISNTNNVIGNYELGIDLTFLNKYSSGISGTSVTSVTWRIEQLDNTIPVADAGQDTILYAPNSYTLDGTNSFDADNDSLLFQWYPPTGITLDDETSPTPSFTITSDFYGMELSFLLSVSDGLEVSTDIVTILIEDDCPEGFDECGVCNGSGATTWYQDFDSDGLGNPLIDSLSCTQPEGYVANSDDEDDTINNCISTTVQSCDDNDPCTINDVETIDNADGSICVPCTGEPIEFCTETTVQSCDDNDPCTENDVETIDNCDGSICVPCTGEPIEICTTTTVQSCDDNDPCTENDVETIDNCDGSICVPCTGEPIEICTETTVQSCDDNDPCTENDVETIDNCDGSICIPCEGTQVTGVDGCDNVATACNNNCDNPILNPNPSLNGTVAFGEVATDWSKVGFYTSLNNPTSTATDLNFYQGFSWCSIPTDGIPASPNGGGSFQTMWAGTGLQITLDGLDSNKEYTVCFDLMTTCVTNNGVYVYDNALNLNIEYGGSNVGTIAGPTDLYEWSSESIAFTPTASSGTFRLTTSGYQGYLAIDNITIYETCTEPCPDDLDADSDGLCDTDDNCLDTYNPDQTDIDGDGIGDVCDDENDNLCNNCDNPILNPNPGLNGTVAFGEIATDWSKVGFYTSLNNPTSTATDLNFYPGFSWCSIPEDGIPSSPNGGGSFQTMWAGTGLQITLDGLDSNKEYTVCFDLMTTCVTNNGVYLYDNALNLNIEYGGSNVGTIAGPTDLYEWSSESVAFTPTTSSGTFRLITSGYQGYLAIDNITIYETCTEPCPDDLDADSDGLCDTDDNCPDTYNPDQTDIDNDGIGDVCDDENDNLCNNCDNPILNPNPSLNGTVAFGEIATDWSKVGFYTSLNNPTSTATDLNFYPGFSWCSIPTDGIPASPNGGGSFQTMWAGTGLQTTLDGLDSNKEYTVCFDLMTTCVTNNGVYLYENALNLNIEYGGSNVGTIAGPTDLYKWSSESISFIPNANSGTFKLTASGYQGYLAIDNITIYETCTDTDQDRLITELEDDCEEHLCNLKAAPNPTSDIVEISYFTEKEFEVATIIYDIMGKKVGEFRNISKMGNNSNSLDLTNYNSGMYFIQLQMLGENQTIKVFKTK